MPSRRPWLVLAALAVLLVAGALALRSCDDDTAPSTTVSAAPSGRPGPRRAEASPPLDDGESPGDRGTAQQHAGEAEAVGATTGSTTVDGGLVELAEPLLADAMRAWLRVNAEAAERRVDEFCEQARKVNQWGEPAAKPRQRDAALYLAGRTDWENHHLGTLHLPDSLTARMADGAWRRFTPADYAGLDFTWMQELAQFDHWSIAAAGPFRDAEQVPFFEAPLPNYITMQNWVKLRLMKGVHEGNLAQASAEVRHLADLIGTSDTLVAEMIRFSLNGIERSVWQDVGQQPPAPLPSADEVQRARHLAFAQMYFLYPGVKREVMAKALACGPTRCTAITEALGATGSLRDIAPGAKEHLEWLLGQSPCDAALAQRSAHSPALSAAKAFDDFGGNAGVEAQLDKLLVLDGGP